MATQRVPPCLSEENKNIQHNSMALTSREAERDTTTPFTTTNAGYTRSKSIADQDDLAPRSNDPSPVIASLPFRIEISRRSDGGHEMKTSIAANSASSCPNSTSDTSIDAFLGDGVAVNSADVSEHSFACGPPQDKSRAALSEFTIPKPAAIVTYAALPPQLPAGYRIFHVPELLELIFMELPALDVLRARRLSHHSRTVIANSKGLRRIIFLERQELRFAASIASPSLKLVRFNPLVFFTTPDYLPAESLQLHSEFDEYILRAPEKATSFINDMYITNPPIDRILVNLGEGNNGRRRSFAGAAFRITNRLIRNEGGVRVSDLVAGIKKNLGDDMGRVFVVSSLMLPQGYEVVENDPA
ncbi:unnamed protein product [Zymoseptoria tritici ST99CH_3D1]|nr:unnamed protein product [Zymoseptoria tritici ST99CH_3D1]